MNGTRVGLCPFRARDVVAADSQGFALGWRVGAALALRRLGVPAEAIEAGEPRFVIKGGATRALLDQWRDLATPLQPYVGSTLLNLALWTITKPIIEGTSNA